MTKIGIIGGTGPEGLGLAMRFAKAGDRVFIGSRSKERAEDAARRVKEVVPEAKVEGLVNDEAVEQAEVVFLTVPWDAHKSTLEGLTEAIGDKVLVDVVVPMLFDRGQPKAILVEEGSAAQQARAVAREAKVISAFHHLDGTDLQNVERPMQGDVLVCGDHQGAMKKVMALVERIEYVRALEAGGLSNSRYLEEWTVLLLHLNRIHNAHTGVRIVGA
ncbi:MAG: NADPH-dependent F420 reductase [Chloroflexi bacterium RBG_16_64_32]|nr:MAG: NADPH-dependent F420 reductase [Chloroflexi bacterium RBG_16_64_32]